jgi:homoserine/homoserine lactone efflux protein
MVNWALLMAFIPTFFFVSITPGMCMTLSMSLGMTIGVRKALWMMWGELIGVGLVATLATLGIAAAMLHYPMVFFVGKLIGGLYLMYLGYGLWCSKGKLALSETESASHAFSRRGLAWQGFITAIANPKGWAFFIALLPPFISPDYPMVTQLPVLIAIILALEFACLLIYSYGGKSLSLLLKNRSNIKVINRLAACLMIGVGVWLMIT